MWGIQATAVNGVGRTNIARLNADGILDNTFLLSGLRPYYHVFNSLAVQSDGKVLIGGGPFDFINGVSLVGIARFNADGTVDSGFREGRFGIVNSIEVQSDGKVLIGGSFGSARLWRSADIPPQLKNINRSGPDVNLSWYAISNRTYRVQYSGNLSANNWTDLAADVSATAVTASKTDTALGDASQRFYRVLLLP